MVVRSPSLEDPKDQVMRKPKWLIRLSNDLMAYNQINHYVMIQSCFPQLLWMLVEASILETLKINSWYKNPAARSVL